MRILFLILCLGFSIVSISQDDKPPTQKEIEVQKQEAIKEAKQQVTDLKKDIAKAKAEKEDPESIQEMEKQLATLEKMVAMLENTNSLGRPKPAMQSTAKKIETKYKSPLIPITLDQPVTAPSEANAKDKLLWYRGKKINSNTLITSSGLIVNYNANNNRVIVQPNNKQKDTIFTGISNVLARTGQTKNDFGIEVEKIENSFLMIPEIIKAYDEFDYFRERYEKIILNVIEMPILASASPTVGNTNSAPLPQPINVDQVLYNLQTQLRGEISSVESQNNKHIKPPPERPSDLCNCDPKKRKDFEWEIEYWHQSFMSDEIHLLRTYKMIYQRLEQRRSGPSLGQAPPDLDADLQKAIRVYIKSVGQKIWELTKMVDAGNIYLEDGLVSATILFEKFVHDFDTHAEADDILKANSYTRIDRVRELFFKKKIFEKYIEDQKTLRNYNVVFDYSLFTSHEINKQILDPSYQIPLAKVWWESLKKFNRFTLTMGFNFDYRLEGSGERKLTATGELESKPMIVSLGRSGCKWLLYRWDANYAGLNSNEDSFYIPVKVLKGLKIIYRDPEPPIVLNYSGPSDMAMVFPNFEFAFCNSLGSDTIYMDKLRYPDKVAKAYMAAHPKIDFDKEYSLDMFQYSNKMFISVLKTKENVDELINIGGDMMNIISNTPMPGSTGNQNLDKLYMDYVMNQKRRSLQNSLTPATNTEKTILKFNANNGSQVILSNTYDTADPQDPDRKVGINLVHGIINIKVLHTPL
jgi:hypothetical protein